MARILSLDTSTDVCSVAIHEEGKLIASLELHIAQSHASRLAILIEQLFATAGLSLSTLHAVAISAGPGSYTGLRIGTSTAKGICYALNIPLIAINTLTVMARHVAAIANTHELLCPMIDARRMEVYCLVCENDLTIVEPVQAKVIDQTSFADLLDTQALVFFGNGAAKCKAMITHPNARFIENIHPLASSVGVFAYEAWLEQRFEDLAAYEPAYLKEFQTRTSLVQNKD